MPPLNLWDEPECLFGIRPIRYVECDTEPDITGLMRNPSQLILGTAEGFHADAEYVLSFIADVFSFADPDAYYWQWPFYEELTRRFFRHDSDAPAWISINPIRVPFESRFDVDPATNTVEEVDTAWLLCDFHAIQQRTVNLGYGIGDLSMRRFLGSYDKKMSPGDPPWLFKQYRERQIAKAGEYIGSSGDRMIYLGHFEADHDRMKRGHIPAISAHYDQQLRLLTTVSFTFATMSRSCEVTQVIVTFHPDNGSTASVIPGHRKLQTFLCQYPLEHELLLQAAGV